jgi:exoribonuclease-2
MDGANVKDLRGLLWSSIDNDSSRDLDQVEVAERVDGAILMRVGIADVDTDVHRGDAIDNYAASQTTSVYAGVRTFPMLPEQLSTDLTSLLQDMDRLAVVIEFLVSGDGSVASARVYRAIVRNRAQLTYSETGPWLEGKQPPSRKIAASAELQAQLQLQNEAAHLLRKRRYELGGLNFDRVEASPVIRDGQVRGIETYVKNQASKMIEDFMVASNESMARLLREANVTTIR